MAELNEREVVEQCLPGISEAELDRVLPLLGGGLTLEPGEPAKVTIKSKAGEEVFRSLTKELRGVPGVVLPESFLKHGMLCPRCDRGIQVRKDGGTGTYYYDHVCYGGCWWSQTTKGGVALWKALEDHNDRERDAQRKKEEAAAEARRLAEEEDARDLADPGDLRRVRLVIEDTLAFWNPLAGWRFSLDSTRTNTWWYALPARWLAGKKSLPEAKLEKLFEHLYGKTWRSGNEDGSKFQVVASEARVLSAAEERSRAWEDGTCYSWGAQGFQKADAELFGAKKKSKAEKKTKAKKKTKKKKR